MEQTDLPNTNLPNNAKAKRPEPPTGKSLVWNDVAMLEAAGNRPEVVQRLMDKIHQPKPSTMAVYQWVSRKRIPDLWRPRLVYALMMENQITLAQLFKVETQDVPEAANDNNFVG